MRAEPLENCPCCGAALNGVVSLEDAPLFAALTPKETEVFEVLARRPGRWVTLDQIINELWGMDIDGGPEDPQRNVYVHICRMRKKLLPSKIGIVASSTGEGGRSRYRLTIGFAELQP